MVCDGALRGCAPVVHRQGLSSFITTPVEDARFLHLYDINLHLKGISKPIPSSWQEGSDELKIDRLAAYQELSFAAIGSNIGVYHRLRPSTVWRNHDAPIASFVIFGNVLVSIAEDGRVISYGLPDNAKDEPDLHGKVLSDFFIPSDFKVTAACHPETYMNKILLGARDGRCMLVNIRSKKMVHVFSGFGSVINVLEPSPAVDVVAVGTNDGSIYLHNFRMDETIVTYRHVTDEEDLGNTDAVTVSSNSVNAIAFRTDSDESMMTGDASGHMFIWDLNQKCIRSEARYVHPGGSSLAHFLPSEPLLITTGKSDNSIKVHIFDDTNGQARVLRSREGHYLPPTMVRFCGYDGLMMVSAGLDRELRLVSAVQEARNRSFSQKGISKLGARARKRRRIENKVEAGDHRGSPDVKLPRITMFAARNARERDEDFANIVTIHEGLESAYTWRLQNGATHEHVLRPLSGPQKYELTFQRGAKEVKPKAVRKPHTGRKKNAATCVTLSPCGNFAYIGAEDGRVHAYNLQSGRHQGVFEDTSLEEPNQDLLSGSRNTRREEWGRAHLCSVVGLSVDACGDMIVSGGSDDKKVKFWIMHTRKAKGDPITTESDIILLSWSTTSDLLAIACADNCVYIYDAVTRKLARRFNGHQGPVVDLCFDINGRRILSASMDSTLKTWDLPSGRLMNSLVCENSPTSVTMAPSGEFIATTHVNSVGIKLWVDMSRFGHVRNEVQDKKESRKSGTSMMDDEDTQPGSESDTDSEVEDATVNEKQPTPSIEKILPLSEDIVTLSTKPTTTWTVLSNLHAIKERNKPVEPPKKAESAPFFIPTKKSIHMEFDINQGKDKSIRDDEENENQGKIKSLHGKKEDDENWLNSTLGKLLYERQFAAATGLLNEMDASGVDMEIRTMEGQTTLRNAAEYFKERLGSPNGFELTQAHLGVFLRTHGSELSKDEQGTELLAGLLSAQQNAWERLRELFDSVLSLSAHFSGQL